MNSRYRHSLITDFVLSISSFRLSWFAYVSRARALSIDAYGAFTPSSCNFKFLPLYGNSDVCRREVAHGASTHAEKPFREIRIARRSTEPLSSPCPSYGSTGKYLHSGIRVSTFENFHATASGESTAVLIRSPAVALKKRFYRESRSVIKRYKIFCVDVTNKASNYVLAI